MTDLTQAIAEAIATFRPTLADGTYRPGDGSTHLENVTPLAAHVAAAVVAHLRPVVTTVAELDALPDRTVYVDANGYAGQISRSREHCSALPVNAYAMRLEFIVLPATVLYRPAD